MPWYVSIGAFFLYHASLPSTIGGYSQHPQYSRSPDDCRGFCYTIYPVSKGCFSIIVNGWTNNVVSKKQICIIICKRRASHVNNRQ